MRIISGKLKGKRLMAPKNLPVRPTTDMAKESLFNILANYFDFENIILTDLFAGTGNISYETASRGDGNNDITAVDIDQNCVKYINKTAQELNLNKIKAIKGDVFKYLESSKRESDVIFCDPPYDFEKSKYDSIINLVFKNKLVKENGFLIIEHSKDVCFEENEHFQSERKYGSVHFSFFQNI